MGFLIAKNNQRDLKKNKYKLLRKASEIRSNFFIDFCAICGVIFCASDPRVRKTTLAVQFSKTLASASKIARRKLDLFSSAFLTIGMFCSSIVSCYGSVDEGLRLIHQGKPQEALSKFSGPIEKGDAQACFYAALVYLSGDNPQPAKGIPLLEKAVHKGYGPALDTYAGLHLHGEFVPQDVHKALMYFEMSAQRGYGPSQFNCGILYKNGEKVPQDLEKAFYYLSLAANNREDLDEVADEAAKFRNEVVSAMSQEQYQSALATFGKHKR